MTIKQELVAHLAEGHGIHAHKGTHQQLALRHKLDHEARHLTHVHRYPECWATGSDLIPILIFLSPPKNPGASRNGDRNWVLNINNVEQGRGQRFELPGTWVGNPDEAKSVAQSLLGWQPAWQAKGWGFEAHAAA